MKLLFNSLVTQSTVGQLLFEGATFQSLCFFRTATFSKQLFFSQELLSYEMIFQNIYFFTASLVFTATYSIHQLVSNPIKIEVSRS